MIVKYWLGKNLSEEHKRKISESLRGKTPKNISALIKAGEKTRIKKGEILKNGKPFKKGHVPHNKGKKQTEWMSEEGKQKAISNLKPGWNKDKKCPQLSGKNNGNWINGKSFEPYSPEFNRALKEQIRKRDNYRCQECFRHQDELYDKAGRKYKLLVHHIDYDKKNNEPSNLISLCRNCHLQTNWSREEWVDYFKSKLITINKKLWHLK